MKTENDDVKLRLRGKGSGYKEGKHQKESKEPLHLYISTKNEELMHKACRLIDVLLDEVYQDYLIFCNKNNINPVAKQLAKKVVFGGNFVHKSK